MQDATEFGGVPGYVQPPETGYVPSNSEHMRASWRSDPTDPLSGEDVYTMGEDRVVRTWVEQANG